MRFRPWLSVLGFCNSPFALVSYPHTQVRWVHSISRYALFAANSCLEGNVACWHIVISCELGSFHIGAHVLQRTDISMLGYLASAAAVTLNLHGCDGLYITVKHAYNFMLR